MKDSPPYSDSSAECVDLPFETHVFHPLQYHWTSERNEDSESDDSSWQGDDVNRNYGSPSDATLLMRPIQCSRHQDEPGCFSLDNAATTKRRRCTTCTKCKHHCLCPPARSIAPSVSPTRINTATFPDTSSSLNELLKSCDTKTSWKSCHPCRPCCFCRASKRERLRALCSPEPGRQFLSRTGNNDRSVRRATSVADDHLEKECANRSLCDVCNIRDNFKSVAYPNNRITRDHGNGDQGPESYKYKMDSRFHWHGDIDDKHKPCTKYRDYEYHKCLPDPYTTKMNNCDNKPSDRPVEPCKDKRSPLCAGNPGKCFDCIDRSLPHTCPWEADITVNGTIRGHCNSTSDAVAKKLTGRFRSRGNRFCADPESSAPVCDDRKGRISFGWLDDGTKLDFSKNKSVGTPRSQNPCQGEKEKLRSKSRSRRPARQEIHSDSSSEDDNETTTKNKTPSTLFHRSKERLSPRRTTYPSHHYDQKTKNFSPRGMRRNCKHYQQPRDNDSSDSSASSTETEQIGFRSSCSRRRRSSLKEQTHPRHTSKGAGRGHNSIRLSLSPVSNKLCQNKTSHAPNVERKSCSRNRDSVARRIKSEREKKSRSEW